MPVHFDRFRLLNDRRFRNENDEKVIYVSGDGPRMPVAPGEEVELPESASGEVLIEVETVIEEP